MPQLLKDLARRHSQKPNMTWPVKNSLCQGKPVKSGRGAPFLKCADANKESRITKKSGKYDTTKETKKLQ